MLKPLLLCVSLSCVLGCSGANEDDLFGDASVGDGGVIVPKLELVCADNFCGTIVDKGTGITTNCGACTTNGVCGDNGIPNVCGAQCVFTTNPNPQLDAGSQSYTPGCDYVYGAGWGKNFGANFGTEVQFAYECLYANPENCLEPINTPEPANRECGSGVCGAWWCCVDNPDAGINPLLPGSVADNDGGSYL